MDSKPKKIELKLRVAPEDIAVLRNLPHFPGALHNPANETLVSVYFDSDDMFLREHGLTSGASHRRKMNPNHQDRQLWLR